MKSLTDEQADRYIRCAQCSDRHGEACYYRVRIHKRGGHAAVCKIRYCLREQEEATK